MIEYMANKEQKLIDHSYGVAKFAVSLFNTYFQKNNELQDKLFFSCLYHDIGKSVSYFDNYIRNNISTPEPFAYHNEIGFGYLLQKLYYDDYPCIFDSILYSHGIPYYSNVKLNRKAFSDIKNTIEKEQENLDSIFDYLHSLYGSNYASIDLRKNKNVRDIEYPKVFNYNFDYTDESFEETMIIRSILYFADREISKLSNNSLIDYIERNISFWEEQQIEGKFTLNDLYKDYFNSTQKQIIDFDVNNHRTVVLKAPTGFGKTLMGIYWSILNKKKVLWVCPDNNTCKAVYNNIKKEVSENEIDISIELFFANTTQESNKDTSYDADIVITNIDNYYYSFYKVNRLEYSLSLFNRNIIFDEFHDFVKAHAHYRLFIEVMKIRTQRTYQKTLLLSATPSVHHKLWDTTDEDDFYNKTILAPSKDTHYISKNNTKYCIDYNDFDTRLLNDKGVVYFANTKKVVQNTYQLSDTLDFIYHSDYTDEDKIRIIDTLYDSFGKAKKNTLDHNLISSFVGEKSIDISFKEMYSYLFSFESILQRIGRVSRWNEYEKATIHISSIDLKNDRSEKTIWDKVYDSKFKGILENYFKNLHTKEVTINDLYILYNIFLKENEDTLLEHYKEILDKGQKESNHVKFYKYVDKEKEDKIILGSSLRSKSRRVYYYCKNEENIFISLDTDIKTLYNEVVERKDVEVIYNDRIRELEQFTKENGYKRLFTKIKNKRGNITKEFIKDWIELSVNPDYPFIDLTHTYYSWGTKLGIGWAKT